MRARAHPAATLDRRIYSAWKQRDWALTGRQYAVAVKLATLEGEWMPITQRQGARITGYSLSGFNNTLRSLRAGGLIAVRTRRGRKGGTWLRAVKGLWAAIYGNVRTVDDDTKRSIDLVTTVRTFSRDGAPGAGNLLGYPAGSGPGSGHPALYLGDPAGA